MDLVVSNSKRGRPTTGAAVVVFALAGLLFFGLGWGVVGGALFRSSTVGGGANSGPSSLAGKGAWSPLGFVRASGPAGGGAGGPAAVVPPDHSFGCRPRQAVWWQGVSGAGGGSLDTGGASRAWPPVLPAASTFAGRVATLCERGVSSVFLQGIPKSGTTLLEVAVVELVTRHCRQPESRCSVLGRPRTPGVYPMIVSQPGCQWDLEVPLPSHYVHEIRSGAHRLMSKHLYGSRLLQEPDQMAVLRNPCHAVLRVVRNPRDTLVSAFFWDEGKREVGEDRLAKTAWRRAYDDVKVDDKAADNGKANNGGKGGKQPPPVPPPPPAATQTGRLLDFAERQFPRLLMLLEMQQRGMHRALGGEWDVDEHPLHRLHTAFYEDLVQQPEAALRQIGWFLGLDVSPRTLNETAHAISFAEMQRKEQEGALPGNNKGRQKVRSGTVNGYEKMFLSQGMACLEDWLAASQLPDDLLARYAITDAARRRMNGAECPRPVPDRDDVRQLIEKTDALFMDHIRDELRKAASDSSTYQKHCSYWLRCLDYVPITDVVDSSSKKE